MKVHNKYHNTAPFDAVYIGRDSPWGNPFAVKDSVHPTFKVKTREEAIQKFEEYLRQDAYLMSQIHTLKGRDLVCFCKPKACHGDVLLRIANQE